MGCGASKDVQNNVNSPTSRPSNNYNIKSNSNLNGKVTSNARINSTLTFNSNSYSKLSNGNSKAQLKPINSNGYNNKSNNGFKQVDIKYSDEYLNSNSNSNNNGAIKKPNNNQPINNNSNGKSNNNKIPSPSNNSNANANKMPNSNSKNQLNNANNNNKSQNDVKKAPNSNTNNNDNNKTNKQNSKPVLPPVSYKEPVAFTISFDDNNKTKVEELSKNKPPPRFQLEPLKSRPQITQEQIEEKMRAVEMKREQLLAEKAKSSRNISMKQETIKNKQNLDYENSANKIERTIDTANRQREAKLDEIRDKQRRHDEKRQRIIRDRNDMNSQELYDLRNREMENDRHYNRDYDYF